ncbi:MAG: hypothetical protein MZV64_61315 [Ignavibacteriales bacterium]|nr:hypothetical protein [Ignavibacteriales bacterium]
MQKHPKDCLYKDEVTEWRKYDNVRFIRAVDEVPAGERWEEDVCLVTKLLQKINMKPDGNPAIVCGPPVMMKFGTFDLTEIWLQGRESLSLNGKENVLRIRSMQALCYRRLLCL